MLKREGADGGAVAFFDGACSAFNFGDVLVGGADVHANACKGIKSGDKRSKFFVCMYGFDPETTGNVGIVDTFETGKNFADNMSACWDAFNGDEIDVARNGSEKFDAVDLKKVSTKGECTVCFENIGWQVSNLVGGDMCGSRANGFAVQGMDVRAIYGH